MNRYTGDIYNPALDSDSYTVRARHEYETQLASKLKDLSKGQREMLMLIVRVYGRLVNERHAQRGEVRAWVSRADIASELRRLKLYRYHINQINKLVKVGLIEAHRRARLSERVNWLGETVQQASGYELIYRPLPNVEAAIKNVKAQRRAAANPPKPVEPTPKPHTPQNEYQAMIDHYAKLTEKLSKRGLVDRMVDWWKSL